MLTYAALASGCSNTRNTGVAPNVTENDVPADLDLYQNFRSEAVALTVRVTTVAAVSTLHVNTMRWLLLFAEYFERDPDPINRYVGIVLQDGTRCKKLNGRSSGAKHVKAINLMLASKNLKVECFHVGEHRTFIADSVAAKAVVLAFCGDKLDLNVRIERSALPLLSADVHKMRSEAELDGNGHGDSNIEMEDMEDATGNWDMTDALVSLRNMVSYALPPSEVTHTCGHPLLSADMVQIKSGESLQAEMLSEEGCLISVQQEPTQDSENSEEVEPKSPFSPETSSEPGDKSFHFRLLRQNSSINVQDRKGSMSSNAATVLKGSSWLPKGVGWCRSDLSEMLSDLRASGVIHDHTYRFKVYRSVFLGSQFVDWALLETACTTRGEAVALGQALLDLHLLRSIPASLRFEDGPSFYRVRDQQAKTPAAADDNMTTWSKSWGRLRQPALWSNRGVGGTTAEAEPSTTPAYKLLMKKLCLQWTEESKEVLNNWLKELSLATRPHPRRRHESVSAPVSAPLKLVHVPPRSAPSPHDASEEPSSTSQQPAAVAAGAAAAPGGGGGGGGGGEGGGEGMGGPWRLQVGVIKASNLPKMDTIGTADAYVTLHCPGDHRHLRSKTIKNTLNPEWKEEFTFEIGQGMYDAELLLKVCTSML